MRRKGNKKEKGERRKKKEERRKKKEERRGEGGKGKTNKIK